MKTVRVCHNRNGAKSARAARRHERRDGELPR
jgi:hypothetical protein